MAANIWKHLEVTNLKKTDILIEKADKNMNRTFMKDIQRMNKQTKNSHLSQQIKII